MPYFTIDLSPDGPLTQKEEQLIYFWAIDENVRQLQGCRHQACRELRAEQVKGSRQSAHRRFFS